MSRYIASGRTSAGSTTLPLFSIYGNTTGRAFISEIGIFNTTTTAVALKLVRLSTTGTRGSAITSMGETQEDPAAATAVVYQTHSVGPTITAGDLNLCTLGGAIGSGVVWSWPDRTLTVSPSTTAGLGLVVATGSGQAVDFYIRWGE